MENTENVGNPVHIIGVIASPRCLTDTTEDGSYYKIFVRIREPGGEEETVPVIVPESCMPNAPDMTGRMAMIDGVVRFRAVYADRFILADGAAGNGDSGQ